MFEGSKGGGQVCWTPPMSSFMLNHLFNLVAGGVRTSHGFKTVHLNACAKALNDHFKTAVTGAQVYNHNRTWKRKWQRIAKLKKLSAALWDEDKCMIVLDHEHYTGHIKECTCWNYFAIDNKEDEPYLNKTLEHYNEMVTIYGNGMAAGDYAKGSSEPLATDFVDVEDDEPANVNATPPPNEEVTHSYNVGESSASRPSKRTKTTQYEEQGLGPTLVAVGERLVVAIEKNVSNDNTPEGLWDNMKTLPTFGRDFLAHYYAYLVENPRIARAFHTLDHDEKMVWVARYVRNNIPSHPEANPHE
ncbi:hypothetical protein BRADI_4g30385v3 [Brachypodium distachyon]|uniref:Myb/SANT-like domain-containing protein n=1 Tax=Brachypodium distachyon TaxID=15368 RepID=A0A0Q3PLH4_BRADI|nr:hypothetical protein BRADI_4g30385v3 [Brachypodium distachyon]